MWKPGMIASKLGKQLTGLLVKGHWSLLKIVKI
jgi:hypothetical protein